MLIMIGILGYVFLSANVVAIAAWLNQRGIPGRSDWIRKEFLTGTAITVMGIHFQMVEIYARVMVS